MNTTATVLFPLCAVILLAACMPVSARNGVQAPPTPQPQTRNATAFVSSSVSTGYSSQRRAIDNNADTWWSAGNFAPQWFKIDFELPHPVTKIELIVSQVRPGPATHRVIARRNGETVVWHRFDTNQSFDGRTFALKIDPPQPIDSVRVLTTRHEGWVAIRELRVMVTPPAISASVLRQPTRLAHASDNSGRLFIAEKEGRIRIVKDGRLLAAPFLDIWTRISTVNDMGLVGLAFSPNYADNGYFYVSYVSADGHNRVSRFSVSPDPDIADPDSEKIILEFHQPGTIHSIGALAFGPHDGYLYIAAGDGGASHEIQGVPRQAQIPSPMAGTILRIDVNSGAAPYTIPPDNPFLSTPHYAPEIWALGLRNPWGIAFDQQTGDLYIPDIGAHTIEEINYQPAVSPGGENYGWPSFEGPLPFAPYPQGNQIDAFVFPVAHYTHADGCAVVGGAVVDNAFYYADFCRGAVWRLQRKAGVWLTAPIISLAVPISGIGAGEDGTLYATGYADGKIYRIDPPPDTQ